MKSGVVNLFYAVIILCMVNNIQAATLNISITDQKNNPVKDAVITLISSKKQTLKPDAKVIIDQVNKTYVPHVKTILAGSKVFFPNKDNIRHHVYSFSDAKKFELPLYEGTPSEPVVFNKPGIVTLGCNIHDWMRAYIYITDTPYFSQTSDKGTASITNIAAGKYQVRIWQPRLKSKSEIDVKKISLEQDSNEFYQHQLDLKPDIKIRRAPKAKRKRY